MIAQTLSSISFWTESKLLYSAKKTSGISGVKSSLYLGCPVTLRAPSVLPWKEFAKAIIFVAPFLLFLPNMRASFNAPSFASAPLFQKNTLSNPVALLRSSVALIIGAL